MNDHLPTEQQVSRESGCESAVSVLNASGIAAAWRVVVHLCVALAFLLSEDLIRAGITAAVEVNAAEKAPEKAPSVTRSARDQQDQDPEDDDARRRIKADVEYLASDALEGRGIDTPGIRKAADYILKEFADSGLTSPDELPTGRQPFPVLMNDAAPGKSTSLGLQAPGDKNLRLKLGTDFQPLTAGTDGTVSGDLVFVGYGIQSEEDQYDDYENVDVTDRIVVLVRREPRQGDASGPFLGAETSRHSFVENKLKLAKKQGAAAVVLVNDCYSAPSSDRDDLSPVSGFGDSGEDCPFIQIRQDVMNELLRLAPLKLSDGSELKTLQEICDTIDRTLKPVSQPLTGWSADLTVDFSETRITAENLIGVIEGDGPNADDTIIVGAHYDHIGYGGFGASDPKRQGEIHNGADDNASGTSAVMELARRFASGPKPNHRIVFICFSAEEKGLFGSQHYVKHPVFPLDQTMFMMNFDMIGHLRSNRVEVNGTGTAVELNALVEQADAADPIGIRVVRDPFGGSDHLPFYQSKIPCLLMFTGMTGNYHTPDDDFATLNIDGIVSVVDYSERLLRLVDQSDEWLTFQSVSRPRRGMIPFLGVSPDLGDTAESGVRVQSVVADSPASRSGIQTGDVLVSFNDSELSDFNELVDHLRQEKPGNIVKIGVRRNTVAIMVLEVTLGAPRN
ncbi:MAG: M20/M25/M40 family metallo-hydrolase [Planctomyces sp.]